MLAACAAPQSRLQGWGNSRARWPDLPVRVNLEMSDVAAISNSYADTQSSGDCSPAEVLILVAARVKHISVV
jgi:hypothetical protein